MQEKQLWTRKSTFILAAAGSAIGLGNIWKFPYMVGENGGGAFVLVYLACIIIIGLPLMIAESVLGKFSHGNAVDAIRKTSLHSAAGGFWQIIPALAFICLFLLFSFYSVIAGWAFDYTLGFIQGRFYQQDAEAVGNIFNTLLASPKWLIFWHTIFTLVTAVVLIRGATDGIEKVIRVLMPLLIIILLIMLVYSITATDQFGQGLAFLFQADFSRLSGEAVISALGHAFFSLSLGMCIIITYAAYMPDEVSITESAIWVTVLDTVIALTAGLVIFPVVFSNGLDAGQGPGLLFVTLSSAFAQMGGIGQILGVAFFFLVLIAALSSSISMVEPVVRWMSERFNLPRKIAVPFYCLLAWAFGLVTVFSFNIWSDVDLLNNGKTPFDLIDYFASNILLPLGGFFTAVYVGWVINKDIARSQLLRMSDGIFATWHGVVKYLAPVLISVIFYSLIAG